jgi:uncharacterized protein involved in exopolysaccharide biosynthesis
LWRAARVNKKAFLFIVFACGIAGVILSLVLPPRYTATVILSPAENDLPEGGLASLAGQFAGIADLAGVNLKGNVNSDEAITILSSREFTEHFIAKNGLLPILFEDDWDASRKAWKANAGGSGGFMQSFSNWVARLTGDQAAVQAGATSPDGAPSLWSAFKMFDSIRRIDKDRKTQMVSVSVSWRDPQIAARWANGLVEELNSHTRERAIHEADRSRQYLETELAKTTVVPMQATLYRLIESELKKAMIASVREEYAFRILDRAIPPMQRASPKRTQIVLGSGLLGIILGVCVALVRERRTSQQ